MPQVSLFRLSLRVFFGLLLSGTAGVAHAFNITFETVDCEGQFGFASVPVEYIYRIDSVKTTHSDVVLPATPAKTRKRAASNIRILNSSTPRGVKAPVNVPAVGDALKSESCPGINTNPQRLRRISVRRPNLETVQFDVFYVTASQAKRLTGDIKRYMAARRTSLERGSSITVQSR